MKLLGMNRIKNKITLYGCPLLSIGYKKETSTLMIRSRLLGQKHQIDLKG